MTARYRISRSARDDIAAVLAWSQREFGPEVRTRYEVLIVAAIRDAAADHSGVGDDARPELGDGVFVWHLARSRGHVPGRGIRHPRRFLLCRWDGDVLVIGRLLHDAMDVRRHRGAGFEDEPEAE